MITISTWLNNTMLIERFMGVAVYVIVLAVAYRNLRSAKSERKVYTVLVSTLIVLTVMGYFYIPSKSADLYRWRELIDGWENIHFPVFFNTYLKHSTTPSSYLFIYLTQKTEIKGVLPATICMFFFAAVFSVIRTEYKSGNVSGFDLSKSFLFFMAAGRFLEVVSGIRCFLALAIVAWCIYKETSCGRSFEKDIVLYIIAATFHLTAIPVIALRMVHLLLCNIKSKGLRVGKILTAIVFCAAGVVFGKEYIVAAIEKGSAYLTQDVYNYIWEYLIDALCLVVIIVTLIKYRKIRNYERYSRLKQLSTFCALMAIVELLLCYEYSIFHRFVMFNTIIVLPIISTVVNSQVRKKQTIYINVLRLISFIILAVACTRGNLCGYKFFVL